MIPIIIEKDAIYSELLANFNASQSAEKFMEDLVKITHGNKFNAKGNFFSEDDSQPPSFGGIVGIWQITKGRVYMGWTKLLDPKF